MNYQLLLAASLLFINCAFAFADQEGGNRAYVKASEWGGFYVKSVPAESYGLAGKTMVYQVEKGTDKLLYTYDWYSPAIYVDGFLAGPTLYVIQLGPWQRGHAADPDHHGIALYRNDKRVAYYSALDIAESPGNVSASVSHYQLFREIKGFRRPFGNTMYFEAVRHDGKLSSFDTETGKLVSPEQEQIDKALYEATSAVNNLKWKWFEKSKLSDKEKNEHIFSEAELREVGEFPPLPAGYVYVPTKMWDAAKFQKSNN